MKKLIKARLSRCIERAVSEVIVFAVVVSVCAFAFAVSVGA
jgi:hypothetical protein